MNIIHQTSLDSSMRDSAAEIINAYAKKLGGITPSWHIKDRPDGPYLIIEFACPAEHHFKIHNSIISGLDEGNQFKERSTVQARKNSPTDRLSLPETQSLKKVIAESLTIDRTSFNDDFFARYTASVTALEQQITTNANFVVYGRRGAGKSSLLAYAMHTAIQNGSAFSWVAMQTFAQRADPQVVPAVISAILYDLSKTTQNSITLDDLIKDFDAISESSSSKTALTKVDRLIPRLRRTIGQISGAGQALTIFLDDIHVLDITTQPLVLAYLYKITRGNNIFIKASGIAQLTTLWDSSIQIGLQPSHDVQVLNLDLNLTTPDKSKEHIEGILDSHARYCGLPNIRYIADEAVLSRLVLVAAGVPRDSLSLFSIAISRAAGKNQKRVSLTSVNAAASEMVEEKLKDIEKDTSDDLIAIQSLLGEVKKFCIEDERKNAFLVEIKNSDQKYKLVQKLIALRLVHLLHEGITPHKAGKRYIALMLDYGFYVGIRAARSVDFVPSEPRQLLAKELRSLPIFH